MKLAMLHEMAMRTEGDLPVGTNVAIERSAKSIHIRFVDDDGNWLDYGDMVIERGRFNDLELWYVADVNAPGWGPFLYDLAIELATRYGDGLTADLNVDTSTDAQAVWRYYFNNRRDVTKHHLPHNLQQRRKAAYHDIPWLNYYYQKNPDRLTALKKAGRLW